MSLDDENFPGRPPLRVLVTVLEQPGCIGLI